MNTTTPRQTANRRLILRLVVAVFAMFGFGFALVPLYDVFCDITGLNGKTGVTDSRTVEGTPIDKDRWVTVEFTGNAASGLPWEFRPTVAKMEVQPGALVRATYIARNTSNRTVVGRAIPSVTPGEAAAHFKKTECFCFTEQSLEAGETKEMTVQFVVEPDVPRSVNTITLSYAFFNAEKYVKQTSVKATHQGAKLKKKHPNKSG
jgi:cytochrome c oxidase assembly protein subunit 11